MSDIIRIDHEALERISAQFGRQSGENQEMLQSLLAAFQPLKNGGWTGRGAEAFFSEMEDEVLPAVRRLIEALAEASQVTGEINEMFQGADEEASTPFKGEPAAGGGGGQFGGGSELGQNGGAGGPGSGSAGGEQFASGAEPGANRGDGQGSGAWGNGTYNPGAAGSGLFDSLLGKHGFTPGEGGPLGDALGGGSGFGDAAGGGLPGGPDFGIPQDFLSGVTDSLNGYMKGNYDDYGVPKDWLSGVEEAFGLDGEGSPTGEAGLGSESGGGSGGGGGSEEKESSGGGSSGGGSGGGGEEPKPEETKPGETTSRERTQPTGMGGGGGGSTPASINEPSSRGFFGQSYSGSTVASPAETASEPGGLQYQAMVGGGGSDSGLSGYQVPTYSSGGGGPAPTEQSGSGGFGLPIGIAAASPFLALLGKALKKKDDE